MTTTTLSPCEQCGAELSEAVHRAAELMYGPPSGSAFLYRLADSLRCATRVIAGETAPSTDADIAERIGRTAVLAALGLPSFTALTKAYQHYGEFGECRP